MESDDGEGDEGEDDDEDGEGDEGERSVRLSKGGVCVQRLSPCVSGAGPEGSWIEVKSRRGRVHEWNHNNGGFETLGSEALDLRLVV